PICLFLVLASPLTLSEIRSMLPAGMTAELLQGADQRRLLALQPEARTAVRLAHGACSCDLVVHRHAVTREDERWLRARYRALGLTRAQTLAAISRHRRVVATPSRPAAHWPAAVSAFVAEHARNAGPTLYLLHFSHDGSIAIPTPPTTTRISTQEVIRTPGEWLREDALIVVEPA
ncbi:MAG: hypothetical protein ABJD11_12330, partial [Gemmatimonadota bacterium]